MIRPTQMPNGIPNRFVGMFPVLMNPPVRLLDTRVGFPACITPGAILADASPTTLQARTPCLGTPPNAVGVFGNATALNFTNQGFLTLYPAHKDRPLVATLNLRTAIAVQNQPFVVALSPGGEFIVYTACIGGIDLVIDISGFYILQG